MDMERTIGTRYTWHVYPLCIERVRGRQLGCESAGGSRLSRLCPRVLTGGGRAHLGAGQASSARLGVPLGGSLRTRPFRPMGVWGRIPQGAAHAEGSAPLPPATAPPPATPRRNKTSIGALADRTSPPAPRASASYPAGPSRSSTCLRC